MVATGEQRLRIAICSVPEGKMLPMCERISEVVGEIGVAAETGRLYELPLSQHTHQWRQRLLPEPLHLEP